MRLRNLRDLGGLPAGDGLVTRGGVLLRSEAPCGLSPAGVDELAALGLRTTVDLRHEGENEYAAASLPDGVRPISAGITPPASRTGDGLIQQVMAGTLLDYSAGDLGALYVRFIDAHPRAFGRAVEHVAEPGNLPVLVHCQAGKDRTGVLVAMVLDVLGVPRTEIVAEYELTTQRRAYRRGEVEPALAQTGTEWARVAALFTAPALALQTALDHVDARCGSVRGYLAGPGKADPAALERLPDLLLEPASAVR